MERKERRGNPATPLLLFAKALVKVDRYIAVIGAG